VTDRDVPGSREEMLRAAYDAYNRQDFSDVMHLVAEDVEVCPPESSLEPTPFRGRDALLRYLEPDLFDFQHSEPTEFVEHGDRILVTASVRARGRGSGLELTDEVFHVWTIDGDRAVRFEAFLERDQALAALYR
jgi:ketosteroid isomerase-like protein